MSDLVDIHFYDEATGMFTGQSISVSATAAERTVNAYATPGQKAFFGVADPQSQRVDVVTGGLVEHRPPQPSDEHEWHLLMRRWVKRPEVQAAEGKRSAALAEIERLEKLQIRSISDLLDNPNDQTARENYDRRKSRIAELRDQVNAGRETIALAEQGRSRPDHL